MTHISNLIPRADKVSLLIHKDKGSGNGNARKKAKKPAGRVKVSVQSVTGR